MTTEQNGLQFSAENGKKRRSERSTFQHLENVGEAKAKAEAEAEAEARPFAKANPESVPRVWIRLTYISLRL